MFPYDLALPATVQTAPQSLADALQTFHTVDNNCIDAYYPRADAWGSTFLGRNAPCRRGSVTISQLCTMLPSNARSKWSAADFFSTSE